MANGNLTPPKSLDSCYWIWSDFSLNIRGVFRAQSNISDGTFCYVCRGLYSGCLIGFWIHVCIFFSLWVNKQSFGGVQNFYKPSELAQTVSLSLLNLSQTFPILRVETGNSPLQGYGEPVCVSIFWSIINIAPLTVLLSTTCFWFKFFIVCQLCILIWNE